MLTGSDIVYAVTGGAGTAALTALSTQTGSTLWSFQNPDTIGYFGTPIFDVNGVIYIESFSQTTGSILFSFDPVTGMCCNCDDLYMLRMLLLNYRQQSTVDVISTSR